MLQNVHRIEGNVTYISLTRGKETMISTSDLERALQVRWYAEYIKSEDAYRARGRFENKPIFLSRYLLNPTKDMWVDHINFDTLDNRRENLRIVTPQENRLHQRRKPGESGMLHISVVHPKNGSHSFYSVSMMREGISKAKGFPCTSEGLQAAQELVAKWQEDFSYDPPRTTQHRKRRSNFLTATIGDGPHVDLQPLNARKVQVHEDIDQENSVFIPLSKEQRAIVDKGDEEKIAGYAWHATPNTMDKYYAVANIHGKTTYMHRFLMDAPTGMYVDHINHNTLDNRRSNLKLCTNQENNTNRNGAYSASKTGIRGVSVHKCKPSGFMYTFKCQCVTCKVCKYFPYTEEGLQAAKIFAEAHYAAMK